MVSGAGQRRRGGAGRWLTALSLVVSCGSCEPADCVLDARRYVKHARGAAPVVITSTHGGSKAPRCASADVVLGRRDCDALPGVCASGPCRTNEDDGVGAIVRALARSLEGCLGAAPAVVTMKADRAFVDANRDLADPGGAACALTDPRARGLWEAFHDATEDAVATAVMQAPGRALLLDVHTYRSLKAAPAPALILGAGAPFGATLPHLKESDPALERVFGDDGVRARLLDAIDARLDSPIDEVVRVEPASLDDGVRGLFQGRYVVHRYALRAHDSGAPPIDALQIEVSDVLRDEPALVGDAIASALCGALGDRLRP